MDGSQPAWRVFDSPGGSPAAGTAASPAGGEARDPRLAILSAIGAVAIGVVAVAVLVLGSGGETVSGPETGAGMFGSQSPGPEGELLVDVSGAVAEPGLYRLGAGARVGDAIEAAGGYSPRVDVERVGAELNLAAPLTDGAQIRVPSRDDPRASAAPGSGGGDGGSAGGLVNLNSASQAELEELPGIGPVTAGKILEARATAPFKTVAELRERGLVGEKTFEQLKSLVTV